MHFEPELELIQSHMAQKPEFTCVSAYSRNAPFDKLDVGNEEYHHRQLVMFWSHCREVKPGSELD